MPRSLPEWIGVTDNSPVPPRVKLRVLKLYGYCCDSAKNGCGRVITAGEAWTCDHIVALVNGGQNAESNLHPLCGWCNPLKTANDMREKSRTYFRGLRHAGIKLKAARPLPGGRDDPRKKTISGRVVDRRTGQPWRT